MNAGDLFRATFGCAPAAVGATPGRVNLIGEHTDYNGGLVMPMAIAPHVDVAIGPGPEGRALIASAQFDGVADRAIADAAGRDWSDYVLGALARFGASKGWRVALDSSIPPGSGLSSSAAVTVGVLRLAGELSRAPAADPRVVARAAQRIENDFIGVPCGIMDQMAVATLRPGECMVLDTATLDFERVGVPAGWRFAVHHSGVYRRLNEGRYAERRAECEAAEAKLGGGPLCPLPLDALDGAALVPTEFRRARHTITEHARVAAARDAMARADLLAFGEIMDASHCSMRNDFEITTPEVDAVVAAARQAGAAGSRMTGGGFGGCIVSLVAARTFEGWRSRFEAAAPSATFIC